MVTVDGGKFNTITLTAGEVYELKLASGYNADIANNTSAQLFVSDKDDFSVKSGVGKYVSIPVGGMYNSLYLEDDTLYLKTSGSGEVSVVLGRDA